MVQKKTSAGANTNSLCVPTLKSEEQDWLWGNKMVRNVLVIMVILVCTTSVVSYGVYNLKDNNKLGGISLFVLAFVTVVGLNVFLVR